MSAQDPVLMGWTDTGRDEETIYESLVKAIETLKKADSEARQLYHVVWESVDHSHGSTKYSVIDFGSHLGEPTLEIEGGRGGKYEIITKSSSYPWIQYLPPNKPKHQGWNEPLVRLVILTEEFEFVEQNGWRVFLDNPFDAIKEFY